MKLSRYEQVKKHCKECAGPDNGNRSASLCTVHACHIWPFRNGTPTPADIEKHLQARADLGERNRLMMKRINNIAV